MSRVKKVSLFLLLIVLLTAIAYRKLIGYGISQLKGQLHIIWNTKPVSEILADPSTPDTIRKKLLLIQDIRKYAVDSIGLKDSKNYSTFFDQKGKPVLWVITACEPFSMKAYEWHFPFLGNVSYKGFFEKEKGFPELQWLKDHAYDTDYGTAGGWSTLGWFKDPILSNMLRRSEGGIAELIIHELTHATVYLPGSVDYNENLATFVGEQGAIRFLSAKYGKESAELLHYTNQLDDEKLYGEYMVASAKKLDSLYRNMPENLSLKEKYHVKYFFIKDLIVRIKDLPLHRKDKYVFQFPDDHLPNNAMFMSYSRYREKQGDFKVKFDSLNGDLKAFMGEIEASSR